MSVCYISEAILERAIVGPAKALDSATHINLQYRKSSTPHHPIKKIEKLHLIPRCRELNLSFNAISRIENLAPLRQLRILNLSENRIRCIEGLEQLKLLEVLDLSGNQIISIPATISANSNLYRLRLSRNKISSLDELRYLSSLSNLSFLDIYENPCMDIPHARPLIIFTLPTIDVLDGESVLVSDREAAALRFDKHLLNELQEQLQSITDLYKDSSKKLIEAEAQLHADERVLFDLREELGKFAEREDSQRTQIRDLEAILENNIATISKSQLRIAELEQKAATAQTCSRCVNIESRLSAQLASERAARIEVEKQLVDMENVMNNQLRIAQGLLAAKSQRFKMEERLRSMKSAGDESPWKAAAYSLLMLCETLQAELFEFSIVIQELGRAEHLSHSLVLEIESLRLKSFQDISDSSGRLEHFGIILPPDHRHSESQARVMLRRVISANSRLRVALASERDRNANMKKNRLRQYDAEELHLQHRRNALRKENVQLEREVAEERRASVSTQKSSSTQTEPENDTTLAVVFACRERTLTENINLLESELKQVTCEIDQLRASSESNCALKQFGDQIWENLLSLQRTRRWAVELQTCKSQLMERDAQIRYLIRRLQQQRPVNFAEIESDVEIGHRGCLNRIQSALDSCVPSCSNGPTMPHQNCFPLTDGTDRTSMDASTLSDEGTRFTTKAQPRHLDHFNKKRFMEVMERLKEEINI